MSLRSAVRQEFAKNKVTDIFRLVITLSFFQCSGHLDEQGKFWLGAFAYVCGYFLICRRDRMLRDEALKDEDTEEIEPATLHFTDPAWPCAYWSSGAHIVANGECRCGLKFVLVVGR